MQRHDHPLLPANSLNTARQLSSFHFGTAGSGQKVYIQASLHADELPGMLVAWQLKQRLLELEQCGQLHGEVILVPVANPIGLDQNLNGVALGRFELASAENFNRHFPWLADEIFHAIRDQLGNDAGLNTQLIRREMRQRLAAMTPASELEAQRLMQLRLACDADIVLDLHCDCDAALHLYTGTDLWQDCEALARYTGAACTLLASESGDHPFDEACSRPWWYLRDLALAANLSVPVELACLAVTIELRGQRDVAYSQAGQDADAILAFLQHRGIIAGDAPAMPELAYPATPLAGSDSLPAPHAGVVHYHLRPGCFVEAGAAIADIIDPLNDRVTTVRARRPGMLYALAGRPYAISGLWLAKVATAESFKTGKLLSA